jgi:protein ImuB
VETLLFAGYNQRTLLTACSPQAEQLGARAGQPLAEARALLPNAVCVAADDAADRDILAQLALDYQRFSPLVGLEESPQPDSLLCDVTGCTHLWDGEEPFLQAIRDYSIERGYHVQLALAGSVGAAWALAHTAAATVVLEGEEEAAVAGLPSMALRLPPTVLARLEALGLRTIRDILNLPRDTLASRFGTILPQRLDQMLGRLPETFLCERLKEPLTVVREWEVPVDDRTALVRLCRIMLKELLALADRHGAGAGLQELEGEFRTENDIPGSGSRETSGPILMTIRLVEPTRDERHLMQLIELHLERQTWSGGILAMRWSVLRLGRMELAQSSWLADDSQRDVSRSFRTLVDRLTSRLDASAVLSAELVPDAQPEHVVRLVPWVNTEPSRREEFTLSPEQSRSRPFRLLNTPQPTEVAAVVPDGSPIRMVWQGQDRMVVRSWGPERIATGWWRAQDVQRDYYRVEWEDGTHVWIFRDLRSGRWWIHGFFE